MARPRPRSLLAPLTALAPLAASLLLAGCSSSDASTGDGKPAEQVLAPIPQGLELPTAEGKVRGSSEGGVRVFKGIPFAAPPVGELRWKAPQGVPSWNGVRDATEFGGSCAQVSILSGAFDDRTSEDCLYLNVWTPDPAPEKALPVMVFFHGGAFIVGSGADPSYDGSNLARHGAVVVTVNYRLGAFGFLAHPKLAADGAAGNFGLLDQRAALEWVRRNARSFGGDETSVTIFGESAGGFSVGAHMVSPGSAPLFHRAAVESGIIPGVALWDLARAGMMADDLAKAVGCAEGDFACLRQKPAADLATALKNPAPPPGGLFEGSVKVAVWLPVVDGGFLPDQPSALFDQGKVARVPLLLGTNQTEGNLFHAGLLGDVKLKTPEQYSEVLASAYGEAAPKVVERYPVSMFPDANAALAKVETDGLFTCTARRMARAYAKAGLPVFRYQLNRPCDKGLTAGLGPTHGAEIPYVFGNDGALGGIGDDSQPLSDAAQGYWSRFAKGGDPNGEGALAWPPFAQGSEGYLSLELPPKPGQDLEAAACDFWDSVPLPTAPKTY